MRSSSSESESEEETENESIYSDSDWSELSETTDDDDDDDGCDDDDDDRDDRGLIHVQKLNAKLSGIFSRTADERLEKSFESESVDGKKDRESIYCGGGTSRGHYRDTWEKTSSFTSFDNVRIERVKHKLSEPLREPFDYFRQYFSDKVFNRFAQFTHLYAKKDNDFPGTGTSATTTTNSRRTRIAPSTEEIKKLFGIHAIMGVLKFPRTRFYWDAKYALSAVSNAMPVNRFFALRSNLRIVGNAEEKRDDNNYLWKVKPLIDRIRRTMRSLNRDQHLSIGKQVIPFSFSSTRENFHSSNKTKAPITSVKNQFVGGGGVVAYNYVLANNRGLILDFEIRPRRNTRISLANKANQKLSAAISLRLVETIPRDYNHFLYFDGHFTSFKLLDNLLELKLFATGVISAANHGICRLNFAKDEDVDKVVDETNEIRIGFFQQLVRSDARMTAVKWFNGKSVTLASTCIGVKPFREVSRWSKKENKRLKMNEPLIVRKYAEFSRGVDLNDRFMSMYRTKIRTRKWTSRLIFYLFDLAIVNAWTQYRDDAIANRKQKILDLWGFRLLVGDTLRDETSTICGANRGRPRTKFATHPSAVRYSIGEHLPVFDNISNSKRCCHCSKKYTFIRCRECDVYLCVERERNCFVEFHHVSKP